MKIAIENKIVVTDSVAQRLAKEHKEVKITVTNQVIMINSLAQQAADARAEAVKAADIKMGEHAKLIKASKVLIKEKALLVKDIKEVKIATAGQVSMINVLSLQVRNAREEAAQLKDEVAYWMRRADIMNGQLKQAFVADLDSNLNFGDTYLRF